MGSWDPDDNSPKKKTRVGESSWIRLLIQFGRVAEVEQEESAWLGNFGHGLGRTSRGLKPIEFCRRRREQTRAWKLEGLISGNFRVGDYTL
jgi:hypothetical protein